MVFYVGLIISQDLPDHKLETLYECDSLPGQTFIGWQTLLISLRTSPFPIGREGLRCYLCCNWSSLTRSNPRYLYHMIFYSFIHSFILEQPHNKYWPLQQNLAEIPLCTNTLPTSAASMFYRVRLSARLRKEGLFSSSNVLNIQVCHGALKEKDFDWKHQSVLNQLPLRS